MKVVLFHAVAIAHGVLSAVRDVILLYFKRTMSTFEVK
jgi:hypothetical protein